MILTLIISLSSITLILSSPLSVDPLELRSIFVPGLLLNNSADLSQECHRSLAESLIQLDHGQLGSTKMFNSFGDFPPKGFVSGTLTDLGHYDQCLSVPDAQYCLLQTRVPLPAKPTQDQCLTLYHTIPDVLPAHSDKTFYQHLANHSVLFYYATLQTGICLPSACSQTDAREIGNLFTKKINLSPSHVHCEKQITEMSFNRIQILAITFLGTVLLLNVYATIVSILSPGSTSFLKWFDPCANLQKLLYSTISENDLGAIHGIRAITIVWIITAHSFDFHPLSLFHETFQIRSFFGALIPQFFFKAYYGVDTFFYISGLLTSYVTLKFTSGQYSKFSTVGFLLARYVRLTPQLLAYLLLTPLLGLFFSGPVWHQTERFMTRTCPDNWFLNLLYVQNFIDVENICAVHTWYLATDMQLHWLSLLLMLIVINQFDLGLWLVKALIVISTLLASSIIFARRLSPGFLITARFDYLDDLSRPLEFVKFFYLPFSHSFVFFAGFLLGCYAWKINSSKRKIKLSSVQRYAAWAIGACMYMFSTFSTMPYLYGRAASPLTSAVLYPLNLTLWSAMLTILLGLCLTNNGGIVNQLLAHSNWRLISRLSYSLYLTHPWVIAAVNGTRREPLWLGIIPIISLWATVVCLSFVVAFLFSVLFEVPVFRFMDYIKNRFTNFKIVTDKSESYTAYQMQSMILS